MVASGAPVAGLSVYWIRFRTVTPGDMHVAPPCYRTSTHSCFGLGLERGALGLQNHRVGLNEAHQCPTFFLTSFLAAMLAFNSTFSILTQGMTVKSVASHE